MARATTEPGADCALCPRLAAFREEWRQSEPVWFNAPVPSFGPRTAQLLIVGLAPGLQGANRTGRPFTGDHAGVLLYDTLSRFGLPTLCRTTSCRPAIISFCTRRRDCRRPRKTS